jgi:4-hydroxy-2-oxoheptanedioate aldolase
MRTNAVKAALKQGMPQVGTWLSLGNVVAARFLARAGFPWLTVDLEHSHTDIQTAAHMFAAIADAHTDCLPLARVPSARHDHIKRALDCGAMGVVVPMVMNGGEARMMVAATRYPPQGDRSVGGNLHALNADASPSVYYQRANNEILTVLQIEHIKAVEVADDITSVPGVDAIFVGPNDLAASMRAADGTPPTTDEFEAALTAIRQSCERHGVAPGLHVFSVEEAQQRIDQGWRFLALNSDLKFLLDAASAASRVFHPDRASGDLAKY